MSYPAEPIQVGRTVHRLAFPELLRLSAGRIDVQLITGAFLVMEGPDLELTLRDLIGGQLKILDVKNTVTATLGVTARATAFAECCPVPPDLILLEADTAKYYLARNAWTYFGRVGRGGDTFLLGFVNHSFRITVRPNEANEFMGAVMAARFAAGSPNIFTTLPADYFLSWPVLERQAVKSITPIDHQPSTWGDGTYRTIFNTEVVLASPNNHQTQAQGTEPPSIGM